MDTPSTLRTAQAVGLTSAFLLSGVYFASSHLMIHNLYPLPPSTAAGVFADIFYKGAGVIVPLALGSAMSWGVAMYVSPKARVEHGVAVAGTLGTLVFTRAVMMGVIDRLLDISRYGEGVKISGEEVVGLLRMWKGMNFVRSGLAFVGGCAGLMAVLGR